MPVSVTTASRLHFGLLRFEQPAGRSYGGLGMMITEPRWRLELSAADRWSGEGAAAAPAMEVARRVLERIDAARKPPALQVRVLEPIPAHRGLGGGTQLGLAVAAGVRRLLDQPSGGAEELAQLAGRGRRSAVGAHGFIHGGLLWEAGRLAGQPLGELAERVAVPSGWRVVLVDAGNSGGLSGDREVDAFSRLPRAGRNDRAAGGPRGQRHRAGRAGWRLRRVQLGPLRLRTHGWRVLRAGAGRRVRVDGDCPLR